MARPKKTPISPEAAGGVAAFQHTYGDPLPTRTDVLQEAVCALLNRMHRMDTETTRQVAVFVKVLAARCAYWETTRSIPQDGAALKREWEDYRDVLCEIALGKKTKLTHCRESILDQGRLLDQYLADHGEWSQCRNLATRLEWIAQHQEALLSTLAPIPCFCSYAEVLVPTRANHRMISVTLTTATLRNLLLSLLHCTTPRQIEKIRKGPGSFTSDALLFRPLDAVIAFPSFDGSAPASPNPRPSPTKMGLL